YQIEVSGDGLFEARRRHSEFQRIACVILLEEAGDEPARKGVATAYAVHDLDFVPLRSPRLSAIAIIVQDGTPSIEGGGEAFAQGDGDRLKVELFLEPPGQLEIPFFVELARLHIRFPRPKAETLLGILLVGDADIHVLHQRAHDELRLLFRPELRAKIEVAAHFRTRFLGGATCLNEGPARFLAESGRDAGPVKPHGAVEDLIQIDFVRCQRGHGAIRAIINDLRASLARARLQKVDTQPIATAHDEAIGHAEPPEVIDAGLTDL